LLVKTGVLNLESGIWNLESEIWNLKSGLFFWYAKTLQKKN